jgi:hypothetical protein
MHSTCRPAAIWRRSALHNEQCRFNHPTSILGARRCRRSRAAASRLSYEVDHGGFPLVSYWSGRVPGARNATEGVPYRRKSILFLATPICAKKSRGFLAGNGNRHTPCAVARELTSPPWTTRNVIVHGAKCRGPRGRFGPRPTAHGVCLLHFCGRPKVDWNRRPGFGILRDAQLRAFAPTLAPGSSNRGQTTRSRDKPQPRRTSPAA